MRQTMAVRWVLGCDREDGGRVTRLCNPAAGWSPRTAIEVIDDITSGRHRYFVYRFPFTLAAIRVVQGSDGPFLRTTPDGSTGNNLDRLPACRDLPRQVPVRVRKNAADLTPEERAAYVAAVIELRNRFPQLTGGGSDTVNWWFKQDQQHINGGPHQLPSFLPWHRELVNRFEALLQQVDPDITVPYWDWTTDPRATPDRTGRLVDLMGPDFMGAVEGDIGEPFLSLYDPQTSPNRDTYRGTDREERAALPPPHVRRRLPPPNRPGDVPINDFDWSDNPANFDAGVQVRNNPPAGLERYQPDDRALLDEGSGEPEPWQGFADWLYPAHSWAHRYMGGDIARADGHFSFRDPFVFLLHSNVDRLYASWQLRPEGDSREPAGRLNSARVYGSQATVPDMTRKMDPWSGGSLAVPPWDAPNQREIHTTDPDVVRPTLYDRYVYNDELCASWAAFLLGRRLPGGHIIQAVIELDTVPTGSTTFRLQLGQRCSWWKGLLVPVAGSDDLLLEVDSTSREAEATVASAGLRGGVLGFRRREWDFWPFSTVRRLAYQVGDLDIVPDASRVTFVWQQE
ncbi:tyrosinase family protein [Nocardioides sp. CER19]|uniref:tyrosinase family protein n=1 Tax=Nocardioides sp. CER19 TaxID=3038538 RepID=UPI0024485174|nr:tyrosinase family protein [Nocardioides sp. CER19]MDH2413794.1 tyrosinase family protein [Nocardioides sp. CER19]